MALVASTLTVLGLVAFGAVRGGDVQLAKVQVQSYVMILLTGYLASMSLRGIRDYKVLGRLIVIAACIRSLYVLWVVQTVPVPPGTEGGKHLVASAHGDSLLFSCATVFLLVRFLEKPSKRTAAACLMILPLLGLGMLGNNRRLVWVQIAAGLLLYAIISRKSRIKRVLAHLMLASLPLFVVYIAVGWNSASKVFGPVRTFRSVFDGKVDNSTLYRDLENFNLLATMRVNPLFGVGFGQPFLEVVRLPDISFFREYRYMPHNSILGLWAFTGPFGFTGLSIALVVTIFLAGRSYRMARSPDERIASFMCIAMVAIYAVHLWGDIGFTERRSIFLVGPAVGMAGQLAMMTGAWRARVTKKSEPARAAVPVLAAAR
jgi:hypothetical protein